MRNAAGNPQGTGAAKLLPLGAGGYITAGIQFANDGTAVCGGDAYGAWVRSPTATKWTQLYESGRIPTAYCNSISSLPGTPRLNGSFVDSNPGCYAITIAPTDSSRIYMTCEGDVLKSTNGGASFTKIGGPYNMPASGGPNASRDPQRRMVVDPQNPNVMMLGPCEGKVVYTTDGGATMNVLTVAAGSNVQTIYPAQHYVAVDPTSAVSGGIKQKWAYSIEGTGIYESTTGPGGTYTLLVGSPANPRAMIYDAAGNLWALQRGATANVWKKTPAGSFTHITTEHPLEWQSIAVDPNNTNRIVLVTDNGDLAQSSDGGATWLGNDVFNSVQGPITQNPTAIRYKSRFIGRFTSAEITFHPTNGKLWAATGVGVSWSNVPATFTEWAWYDDSLGIEELEVAHIMVPPGGSPIVSVHDQLIFKVTDENGWNNLHRAPDPSVVFGHGWFVDYAPSFPNFLVGICGYQQNAHGYSNDYGDSWTPFAGSHPDVGTAGTIVGGAIVAASKLDFYWFPSNNIPAAETHDGGATWTRIAFTGLPTSGETGWGYSLWNQHQPYCSDKTNGDVYIFNYGPASNTSIAGVYKRALGASGFTKISGPPGGFTPSILGKMKCVDGQAGHLFFSGDFNAPLHRSTNGGVTWTAVANTTNVQAFGIGKAAPGKSYPTIFMYGSLNGVRGLYRSDDNCVSWVALGEYPANQLGTVNAMAAHPDVYGRAYLGFAHNAGVIIDYKCGFSLN